MPEPSEANRALLALYAAAWDYLIGDGEQQAVSEALNDAADALEAEGFPRDPADFPEWARRREWPQKGA